MNPLIIIVPVVVVMIVILFAVLSITEAIDHATAEIKRCADALELNRKDPWAGIREKPVR